MSERNSPHRGLLVAAWATIAVCLTGEALGAEAAATPDKSGYSIFNPTPDSALRSFSPDRPLNAVTPYTVDAGRLQVESDFLFFTQSSDRLTTTRTLEALDPEIRLGLTQYLEFDLLTTGLLTDRTTANGTGRRLERDTGTGPVTLRARYSVFGDDGGTYAFSVLPFVTIPSGDRHFSDPKVEGGVLAPLNISLPSDFGLVLETGVQSLHSGAGSTFASFTNLANLSHAVPGVDHLTASIEFTSIVNADRSTPDLYTFETALAYLATPTTQLDVGGFIGLNRDAPDFQVAAGISHRF